MRSILVSSTASMPSATALAAGAAVYSMHRMQQSTNGRRGAGDSTSGLVSSTAHDVTSTLKFANLSSSLERGLSDSGFGPGSQNFFPACRRISNEAVSAIAILILLFFVPIGTVIFWLTLV